MRRADKRLSSPFSPLTSPADGAETVASTWTKFAREEASARRGSATKVATDEAAADCGAMSSRVVDWSDGSASVGGVCELVGPTMDEARCGAAAADASPGETTATGALSGSGIVATTAFSSSDARPLRLRDITTLAAEAMAFRRSLLSACCSEGAGSRARACGEASGRAFSAIRLSDSIMLSRGESTGAEKRRATSFAPLSARDPPASSRVGAAVSSVDDPSDGAGADCASTAGRQLMSNAGTATKASICGATLLVASAAAASSESDTL